MQLGFFIIYLFLPNYTYFYTTVMAVHQHLFIH